MLDLLTGYSKTVILKIDIFEDASFMRQDQKRLM